MSGGIVAYNGGKAVGGEDFGMEYFVQGDFADAFQMSYAMEEGLRQLYLAMEEQSDDAETKVLLGRLAVFEEGHKAKLKAMFPAGSAEDGSATAPLEGGFERQQILDHFQMQKKGSTREILELGMMLETQALDLYSRLGRQTESKESRDLFKYLVKEETQHLNFLSRELDTFLAG